MCPRKGLHDLIKHDIRELEKTIFECRELMTDEGEQPVLEVCEIIGLTNLIVGLSFVGISTDEEELLLELAIKKAQESLQGESYDPQYNILVLGTAGVGKSSFINYLIGQDVMETGAGKVVTTTFKPAPETTFSGVRVVITDSKGLQVGVSDGREWLNILEQKLAEHSIDKPVEKWFHTIFYCTDGERFIGTFQVELVKSLLERGLYVTIVLTKADQRPKGAFEEFSQDIHGAIKSDKLAILPVCSKRVEMVQYTSEPFGREKIISHLIQNVWYSIKQRLPSRCVYRVNEHIDVWANSLKDEIRNMDNLLLMGITDTVTRQMESFKMKVLGSENETSLCSEVVLSEIHKATLLHSYITGNIASNHMGEPVVINDNVSSYVHVESSVAGIAGATVGTTAIVFASPFLTIAAIAKLDLEEFLMFNPVTAVALIGSAWFEAAGNMVKSRKSKKEDICSSVEDFSVKLKQAIEKPTYELATTIANKITVNVNSRQ